MTKAQKVRNRRLEKQRDDIISEAKRVFDWMWCMINENTEGVYFNSFEVFLPDESYDIQITRLGDWSSNGGIYMAGTYRLKGMRCYGYDRLEFFSTLKEVVEQEEGFEANINPNTIFYDIRGITFQLKKNIISEAERVFDWILDLIDENTKRGYFVPLKVFLPYDGYEIQTIGIIGWKNTYLLDSAVFEHGRTEFFSTLKKVVERKKNFEADINPRATFQGKKGIIFKIVVE